MTYDAKIREKEKEKKYNYIFYHSIFTHLIDVNVSLKNS